MAQPIFDHERCAMCGWTLAPSVERGCVPGNCSLRPWPDYPWDHERAEREYGRTFARRPPSAESILREQIEEQAELHRMQLAAVGTAALGNTRNSAFERITRESPYWTLAYADVCSAVDREIDLREQLETAKDRIYQLEQGRLAEWRKP